MTDFNCTWTLHFVQQKRVCGISSTNPAET